MTEQKIKLKKNQFLTLFKQIKARVITEYRQANIPIKETLKSALWTHVEERLSELPFWIYILNLRINDPALKDAIIDIDKLVLYRLNHDFESNFSLEECGIKSTHLTIFAKFLGFKTYEEFFDHAPAEKIVVADSGQEKAMQVIDAFYDHLVFKRFDQAFKLLSPSFRAREPWKGDVDRFIEGYQNFRGIKNKHVFNASSRSTSVIECLIYYEDDVEINIINEINQVESMLVKDIDLFAAVVKKLADDIHQGGGKDFAKTTIHKLFDPAASEYIWYKCGFTHPQFEELYSAKKGIWIRRL